MPPPPGGVVPWPLGLAAACRPVGVAVGEATAFAVVLGVVVLGVPGNKGGVPMMCWVGVPNVNGVPVNRFCAVVPPAAAFACGMVGGGCIGAGGMLMFIAAGVPCGVAC